MDSDLEKQRQQDAKDFNDELAGRETGRLKRFFPGSTDSPSETTQRREEREFQSLLRQMLLDPAYAAAYQDAQNAINDAQSALDRAVLQNAQNTERLTQLIEEMERTAPILPDGERVFRSEGGNLYTESGRRLNAREAAEIEPLLLPDAPTYEQYTQANDALDSARERGRELARIQTDEIDPARQRLGDEDNPPSVIELRDMKTRMGEIETQVEMSSATDFEAAARAPVVQHEPTQEIVASELEQMPRL